MRFSGLFIVLSFMVLAPWAQAKVVVLNKANAKKTKKQVHIVAGNPSNRTQLNMHPSKRLMVLNALVQTCDPKPSKNRMRIVTNKSSCLKDKSSIPAGFSGNTLELVVKYDETTSPNSFDPNCATPKQYRFAIANSIDPKLINRANYGNNEKAYTNDVRNAQHIQDAIKNCKAQNLSVRGESDTKEILGQANPKLKKFHQAYNTKSLNSPQACNRLDKFKKVNFEGLAPSKDPKVKNGVFFRNGGFRIGNHTYFEYDGKNKQWCRTTYQPQEIKGNRLISREEVISRARSEKKCAANGDAQTAGAVRPLPLPELRNGKVFLRGSITLLPDGRAYINPVNKTLDKVNYQGIKQASYKQALSKGKKGSKEFIKAYINSMKKLYKQAMSDPKKLSLKDLRAYDKSKGYIAMQVKEDEHGLRDSVISTYDKDNKHLRSIEMKPTNVIGSRLNNNNSWCGGENCLRLNTKSDTASSYIYGLLGLGKKNRAQLSGIDAQATCAKNAKKPLEMTGGENVCMSCFGNTPGACKTDPVAPDDGFKTASIDPNDPIIGKYDSIEKNVKARYAESKKQRQCSRVAAQELNNKVAPYMAESSDTSQQVVN